MRLSIAQVNLALHSTFAIFVKNLILMKKLSPDILPSHLTLLYAVFILLFGCTDFMYSQQSSVGLDFNILSTTDGFPTNEIQKVYQDGRDLCGLPRETDCAGTTDTR